MSSPQIDSIQQEQDFNSAQYAWPLIKSVFADLGATPFFSTSTFHIEADKSFSLDTEITFDDLTELLDIDHVDAPPAWISETHGGSPILFPVINAALPWALNLAGTAPASKDSHSWTYRITDDESVSTDRTVTLHVHLAPDTDAGADQDVNALSTVNLDGTASTDPDGGSIVGWSWSQVSGTPVSIQNPYTATPHFSAPNHTEAMVFRLETTNTAGFKSTDTVTINVTNHPPTSPEITTPTDGQRFANDALITVEWNAASDPDGLPPEQLRYNVLISTDEGSTWEDVIALTDPGILTADVDMSGITKEGKPTIISVRAYDGDLYGAVDAVTPSFIPNVTSISADPPAPFVIGVPVNLLAVVIDRDTALASCTTRYYWSTSGLEADKILLGTKKSDEQFVFNTVGLTPTAVGRFYVDATDEVGYGSLWQSSAYEMSAPESGDEYFPVANQPTTVMVKSISGSAGKLL